MQCNLLLLMTAVAKLFGSLFNEMGRKCVVDCVVGVGVGVCVVIKVFELFLVVSVVVVDVAVARLRDERWPLVLYLREPLLLALVSLLVCDKLDESDDDDVFFLKFDEPVDDEDDNDDGDDADDVNDAADEFAPDKLDFEPFCCFFFGRYL